MVRSLRTFRGTWAFHLILLDLYEDRDVMNTLEEVIWWDICTNNMASMQIIQGYKEKLGTALEKFFRKSHLREDSEGIQWNSSRVIGKADIDVYSH